MRYGKTGLLAASPMAFGIEMLGTPIGYAAPFDKEGSSAVVCIRGMLTHHQAEPWFDCYDSIRMRVTAALESDCSSLILRLDSLGGDVGGCFDLAKWITESASKAGKRVLAYVEGHAASAAYALACSADTIGVSVTGFVGSIGVISAILDQTRADAAMGIQFAFATSGARKGDGNPHIPLTEDAYANLQAQVDELAQVFYNWVSVRRGLTIDTVAGFQAGMYFGNGAIASRLADRVCSWSEMVSAASETVEIKMAKYSEQAKELASRMLVDGDDNEKAMARRMLAADEKEEEKAKGEEGAGDKKEAPKEEAKAADDKEEPKAAEEKEEMKAAAIGFDLLKEVHALKAKMAAKEDVEARAALFATRPDFDTKTRNMMSGWPVNLVKQAVETFPKIGVNPAAAAQATGTRGSGVAISPVATSEAEHIDRMMGLMGPKAGVRAVGFDNRDLELGYMTPAQAAAKVAALDAAEAAKGAK